MKLSRSLAVAGLTFLATGLAVADPTPLPTLKFVIPQLQKKQASPQARTPAVRVNSVSPESYWWNSEEFIEALGLEPEQRSAMDAAMAGIGGRMADLRQKENASREGFDNALQKRDWDAARAAAVEWETAFAQSWGCQNQSKIDVLKQLTPSQHEKLTTEYSYLLGRPWSGGQKISYTSPPRTPESGAPPAGTPAQP